MAGSLFTSDVFTITYPKVRIGTISVVPGTSDQQLIVRAFLLYATSPSKSFILNKNERKYELYESAGRGETSITIFPNLETAINEIKLIFARSIK